MSNNARTNKAQVLTPHGHGPQLSAAFCSRCGEARTGDTVYREGYARAIKVVRENDLAVQKQELVESDGSTAHSNCVNSLSYHTCGLVDVVPDIRVCNGPIG